MNPGFTGSWSRAWSFSPPAGRLRRSSNKTAPRRLITFNSKPVPRERSVRSDDARPAATGQISADGTYYWPRSEGDGAVLSMHKVVVDAKVESQAGSARQRPAYAAAIVPDGTNYTTPICKRRSRPAKTTWTSADGACSSLAEIAS